MKHQIKNRITSKVLFECDIPDDVETVNEVKYALAKAVKEKATMSHAGLSGADLYYANLSGADLSNAILSNAYLSRANLSGADLTGADLSRANLSNADLSRANLSNADLTGADLSGADLNGAKLNGANLSGADLSRSYLNGAKLNGAKLKNNEVLVGNRPIFSIGPIGSRPDNFIAYITDKGIRLDAGCKKNITLEEFEGLLSETHGNNVHGREYRAALALISIHHELWGVKK
jgi:uncharacterized protein YjbI with pentapeptide repeats